MSYEKLLCILRNLNPEDLWGRQQAIRQYCYYNQLDYFELYKRIW